MIGVVPNYNGKELLREYRPFVAHVLRKTERPFVRHMDGGIVPCHEGTP